MFDQRTPPVEVGDAAPRFTLPAVTYARMTDDSFESPDIEEVLAATAQAGAS